MADHLDQLEAKVLEAFSRQEPVLAHLMRGLEVSGREYTQVGRFTIFTAGPVDPFVPDQIRGLNAVIEAPGLAHGIGASITVSQGRVEFLELVSFGGESGGPELASFSVRRPNNSSKPTPLRGAA